MVESVSRGLYVTRFWYVRDVHPLRTVITGMTREGTFLIENGRITRPVKDLRFTQSIVEALANVVNVSRERRLELGEGRVRRAVTLAAHRTIQLHVLSFTSELHVLQGLT